ncbi:MAG: AmmeMemoRadiSam system protein A [Acidobacteria bacterium]|nr:AmmeMemoRadiSam system protein A [Acidobacteriota bacterium]
MHPPAASPACEYSGEERRLLLSIAHDAIGAALRGSSQGFSSHLASPSPHLSEARGAFTTLHLHDRLRGCVGFVQALRPLFQTVAETAVAAAFNDPRFDPVTDEEARLLKIEISVLSPLRPITLPEIEIGRHGLVVTHRFQRGLLLPQVAVEHGWDRETFLAETCQKAGLAPDAWRHSATVEGFTAEVFGDERIESLNH